MFGFGNLKLILSLASLIAICVPGVLGYRYVTRVIEDNKTLTIDRDNLKGRATYWYQQNQATLQRLSDAQSTMSLLAYSHEKATTAQRRITNAFKQPPTAGDAGTALNDAFGVLACSTGGPCSASPANPTNRPARP